MFFIDSLELDRLIRLVRERHSDEAVSEDLRGWSWEGRLSPYENFYFGVGELANRYCPTYRDIYLRRVLKIQAPYTFKTVRGWVYHAVSADALTRVKAVLYSKGITPGYKIVDYLKPRVKEYVDKILKEYNVDKYLKNEEVKLLRRNSKTLYNYLILQAAASVDRVIASSKYLTLDSLVHQAIPDVVEMRIDGSPIGLSRELKVDIYLGRIVADIKTGDIRDFHKYTLAGYALAIEADKSIPVDYGLIIYLSVEDDYVKVDKRVFYIGDELRSEFLEMRDEATKVILSGRDPGKPLNCPEYCIYYNICHGGRV